MLLPGRAFLRYRWLLVQPLRRRVVVFFSVLRLHVLVISGPRLKVQEAFQDRGLLLLEGCLLLLVGVLMLLRCLVNLWSTVWRHLVLKEALVLFCLMSGALALMLLGLVARAILHWWSLLLLLELLVLRTERVIRAQGDNWVFLASEVLWLDGGCKVLGNDGALVLVSAKLSLRASAWQVHLGYPRAVGFLRLRFEVGIHKLVYPIRAHLCICNLIRFERVAQLVLQLLSFL